LVESVDKFPALNSVPRASAISSALLTYEPYYGLREKPFSLWTAPSLRVALANAPVQIPADVTQSPPPAEPSAVQRQTPPIGFR
jgi:hypothetical protein